MKQELASDYNREATLEAKLGRRDLSLANHGRAVEMSRELTAANPADYEVRFALALALSGRADAYVLFAHAPRPVARAADLAAAERDYDEALGIYASLQQAGTFPAADQSYVDEARARIEKVRAERR
jgi:hypothetical protein